MSKQFTLSDGMKNLYRPLLLLGEHAPALWQIVERYEAELVPVGGIEDSLFLDLIHNQWRIWRIRGLETALLNHQLERQGPSGNRFPCGDAVLAFQNVAADMSGILPLLMRLESHARRAWQSTMNFFLKYRVRLAKFRKAAPPMDETATEPATPAPPTNEPAPPTNEKETPCSPQPEPSPTN